MMYPSEVFTATSLRPGGTPRGRPGGPLGTQFLRNDILAGAARVFTEKPVAEASVEDILLASGISRRTFYRSFRSKEEVLAALFDVSSALFVEAFRNAASSDESPSDQLRRCVDTQLEFSRSSGPLMRMLQGESQRPDSLLAPRRKKVLNELGEMLDAVVRPALGRSPEPFLVHGVLVALEAITWSVLELGPSASERDLKRARHVMQRLLLSLLSEPDRSHR